VSGVSPSEAADPNRGEGGFLYTGPIINIHTHLRLKDDLSARVANWRKWNLRKVVCLSVHDRWRAGGYAVNDDYPALMERYPGIIVGFAGVNLVAGEVDRPDALDRFREQGFEGLKFEDNSYPYSHEIYWPLYERANRLQMPILFHTGDLAPLRTDEVNYDARDGPEENQALRWFEKLCFATDNPEPDVWVPAAEYIMDQLQIPELLRRKFYHDTAAGILGISEE